MKTNPEWMQTFIFALMGTASEADDATTIVHRAAAIADAAQALRKERSKGEEQQSSNNAPLASIPL